MRINFDNAFCGMDMILLICSFSSPPKLYSAHHVQPRDEFQYHLPFLVRATLFFQNDALSFETGDRDWCVSQRRLIRVIAIAGNGESCVSNTTNIFLVHWTQNCRQEHFPQL